MIVYRNQSTDPYFNLAAEQYLLDTKSDSIFMLWRNDASVIIGKNQNAYAELDLGYVDENKIKVVRRLTGGGAVFHDKGNVNFSFIVPAEENATLDFGRFTAPVINAIKSLGVEDVCLSGRNDILICGEKISGNAQSFYNNKTLHHGTLLYSSDLTMLTGALRVDPEKIRSKGIKSVRNRVGNISSYLKNTMSAEEFMTYLEGYIAAENNAEIVELSQEDIKEIKKLADEKYSTWEWNFGRSKEYVTEKKKRYSFGGVAVLLTVEEGVISQIKVQGDFFGTKDVGELEGLLLGKRFEPMGLRACLEGKNMGEYIHGMDTEGFIELLMS